MVSLFQTHPVSFSSSLFQKSSELPFFQTRLFPPFIPASFFFSLFHLGRFFFDVLFFSFHLYVPINPLRSLEYLLFFNPNSFVLLSLPLLS